MFFIFIISKDHKMKRLIPFFLALIAISDVSSQAFSNIDFQEMYYGCICGTVGSDEGFVTEMSNLGPEMNYIVTSLNGASEISVDDGTITFGAGENGSVAFTWDGETWMH